jgi:hypothetical protein
LQQFLKNAILGGLQNNNLQTIANTYDTGITGVFHLKRFWSIVMAKKYGQIPQNSFTDEWVTDMALLDALGIGIEQVFTHLYHQENNFEAFEQWVIERNNGQLPVTNIERFHHLLQGNISQHVSALNDPPVLDKEDLRFWDEHGYVVVPNAITADACNLTEELIWQHLGMDKNDPTTWYQSHQDKQGIMIQLFQHPLLQANRESRKIRKVYEQLWGTDDLWINTDRVGFNPPETDNWKFPGPGMHWDVSLELPIPFGLQGILYLVDVDPEQGAFTLVPGFQHKIEQWIRSLPPGTNPRTEDIHALGSRPIKGKAGDFIIWHHALPHGSRPNTTSKPRIVQYINLQPVQREIRTSWR